MAKKKKKVAKRSKTKKKTRARSPKTRGVKARRRKAGQAASAKGSPQPPAGMKDAAGPLHPTSPIVGVQ
jgi:hypothetical protein